MNRLRNKSHPNFQNALHALRAGATRRLGTALVTLLTRTILFLVANVFISTVFVSTVFVSTVIVSTILLSPEHAYAHPLRAPFAQDAPVDNPEAPAAIVEIEPNLAPVQIDLSAAISGNVVAYTVYATNVTDQSVWDLNITIPIPEETQFLSAEATDPAVADDYDNSVSFYVAELKPGDGIGPQRLRVSTGSEDELFISTQAEATWKYVNTVMRQSTFLEAGANSSPISMHTGRNRLLVADMVGEVPLANVDMTGVSVQDEGSIVRVDFLVAGPIGPTGEDSEFILYIDNDCDPTTGRSRGDLGMEYRVRYRHVRGTAEISAWMVADDTSGQWLTTASVAVNSPTGGQTITLWIPSVLLENSQHFCWSAESQMKSDANSPRLPKDFLPNGETGLMFTRFGDWNSVTQILSGELLTATTVALNEPAVGTRYLDQLQLPVAPSMVTELAGKVAIPLDNAQGSSDVYIFSLPDGQQTHLIPDAHNPVFRSDGTHLLTVSGVNNEKSIQEYELVSGDEVQSRAVAQGAYPFYNLQGSQIVYEDWQLNATVAATAEATTEATAEATYPIVLLQCNLLSSSQEAGEMCQSSSEAGNHLQLTDSLGDIYGTNPLWTADERFVYRGCRSWNGLDTCGIFTIGERSTNNGTQFFPILLTQNLAEYPTDTKHNFITTTSQREGNWEVYARSIDGKWVVNLSNDQNAKDGLSTISPDGNWVAFVSDRDGDWALWVSPITGDTVHKLFDLPSSGPWESSDQAWTHERISWGF